MVGAIIFWTVALVAAIAFVLIVFTAEDIKGATGSSFEAITWALEKIIPVFLVLVVAGGAAKLGFFN